MENQAKKSKFCQMERIEEEKLNEHEKEIDDEIKEYYNT
jgi:hypothetical protein